jgi:hypothetical protein
VLQAGVSLFKNIPVAGAAISATDLLNNIIKEFDNDNANNPKTLDYVNSLAGLAASVAPLFVSNPVGITGVCASSSAKSNSEAELSQVSPMGLPTESNMSSTPAHSL